MRGGISDHIRASLKSKLVDSGIVINREVEISHVPGAPVGDRTDMKIDAIRVVGAKRDILTAIFEVKGCWNRERDTAMQEQLIDDYMVRTGARVGFLLVGWFEKDGWDPSDHRRDSSPAGTIDDLQAHLNEQASALSKDGILIRAIVIDYRMRRPRQNLAVKDGIGRGARRRPRSSSRASPS